jgi:hypothetical protein
MPKLTGTDIEAVGGVIQVGAVLVGAVVIAVVQAGGLQVL